MSDNLNFLHSKAINPKKIQLFPQDTGVHSHTISTNGPGTSSNEMVQPYPTKHSLSLPPTPPPFRERFRFHEVPASFRKTVPQCKSRASECIYT
ncbi:hypothetical protein CDAR_380781 [Caerostris darwini]|uniref:Uncharacterized protein n=1 Tax=Caerostris darwini TaxID=1538125 RepID=A0AAV4QSN0_9ARAC|nr:hypothetical protein CDAR_380781 [Caerostris darwini]